MKKYFLVLLALLFAACSSHQVSNDHLINEVADIKDLSYDCDSQKAYVANILGHRYISDMGIKCFVGKRTINQAIDLKKVYLHRIDEMPQNIKVVEYNNSTYYIDKNFGLSFYVYLKNELEYRGIVVTDKVSPYVMKVDTNFVNFKASIANKRFNSKVWIDMHTRYNGFKKTYKISTFQSVDNYTNIYDTPFFSDLLMRQLANKAASVISNAKL